MKKSLDRDRVHWQPAYIAQAPLRTGLRDTSCTKLFWRKPGLVALTTSWLKGARKTHKDTDNFLVTV
jgi:hypothetical protein